MDWTHWYRHYDVAPSFQARLRIVREQIGAALRQCPAGPVTIVSVCAGDGRDVIGALADHPRKPDVTAWLLDTHAESLARGRQAAAEAGMERQVRFLDADAARADSYAGIVPADLVLMSGFLGHLPHADISALIEALPMFCKTGGGLIWNRHLVLNGGGQQVPAIRAMLGRAAFQEVHFETTGPGGFAVGRVCFTGRTIPLDATRTLFHFVGIDQLIQAEGPAQVSSPAATSVLDERRAGEAEVALSLADVEHSIPARFEKVAEHYPFHTAIGSGQWQPTYRELDAAANRLARALLSRGGRAGDQVALLLRHDGPLVAAALAVLKAGRAVVVLNPGDPPERLKQILADADPSALVTDQPNHSLAGQIAPRADDVIYFEEHIALGSEADSVTGEETRKPAIEVAPESLAFLIYTSGSSGRPKGVMQTHRNIIHNIVRHTRSMRLTAEDRILLLASPSGGQGMATLWCALLNGGALLPFPAMDKGVVGLADWIDRHRVTVYVSSASLFHNFARTLPPGKRFPSVRMLRLGSESATAADFALFRDHFNDSCIFLHTLSSSEAGNITHCHLTRNDLVADGPLPLGLPADGIELLLRDEAGQDLPPLAGDQVGEMVLRGRYLSPGYWQNESLTAERFAAQADGVRTFRSGDLALRKEDGTLLYAGRKDAQVKIHGYRVEAPEIEAVLKRQNGVLEAVVCAGKGAGDDLELAAYVVAKPGRLCSVETLRNAVRSALPAYMVPTRFTLMERLPLTPHGKIDRETLRQFAPPAAAGPPVEGPATDTERILADAWQRAFGHEGIGRQDDFFALGGDSLKATVVAAIVHDTLSVQLHLRAFSDHPTLAALAEAIDRLRGASPRPARESDAGAMIRVSRDRPAPLSYMQERLWTFCQTAEGSREYRMTSRHLIRGPLDAAVFGQCLRHLAERHEMCRTTFGLAAGKPVQTIHPSAPELLEPLVDLSGQPDAQARATELLGQESRRPFDLARLPLMRFRLVRIRSDEHWLFRVYHHILADEWSWKMYFRELARLYEAQVNGLPCPLIDSGSPDRLQYADFATWQRQAWNPEGPAWRESVEWWSKTLSGQPRPPAMPFRRRWPFGTRRAESSQGQFSIGIDPAASDRLDLLGRQTGVTFLMVRLAGFAALLAAKTRQPDLILGSYAANRDRLEVQDMFGFFSNLIALRMRCDPSATFRQWLDTVRQTVSETLARGDIPFEQLCQELGKLRPPVNQPVIQAIISVADRTVPLRFAGLELTALDRHVEVMPWGFNLSFEQHEQEQRWYLRFDARLYHPGRVREFVDRLGRFFDAASRDPDRTIAQLCSR